MNNPIILYGKDLVARANQSNLYTLAMVITNEKLAIGSTSRLELELLNDKEIKKLRDNARSPVVRQYTRDYMTNVRPYLK